MRLSNRGTDEAGPNFVLGQVMVNGLLDGQTNLGALFGAATDYAEYHGLGLLANVAIGGRSGRLAFSGFRSRSNPQEPLIDRDHDYLRDRASITYIRPVPGFERATLTLSAALDADDLEILRSGARLRDERLRMLTIGPRWTWRQRRTQYLVGVELVKGLDGLGSGLAALDLTEDLRRSDFTLSRFTFTRFNRVNERWSVRLDALGQQSAYTLPYGERFKIGGDRLGRGFEVAEIAGDQGIGAKVDVRRALPQAPAALHSVSIYGFYDIGAAWKQDMLGRESAATAALGREAAHASRRRGPQRALAVRRDRARALAKADGARCSRATPSPAGNRQGPPRVKRRCGYARSSRARRRRIAGRWCRTRSCSAPQRRHGRPRCTCPAAPRRRDC